MKDFIRGRVVQFAGKWKRTVKPEERMLRDRQIASIINAINAEYNAKSIEFESYMVKFITQVIKDELK